MCRNNQDSAQATEIPNRHSLSDACFWEWAAWQPLLEVVHKSSQLTPNKPLLSPLIKLCLLLSCQISHCGAKEERSKIGSSVHPTRAVCLLHLVGSIPVAWSGAQWPLSMDLKNVVSPFTSSAKVCLQMISHGSESTNCALSQSSVRTCLDLFASVCQSFLARCLAELFIFHPLFLAKCELFFHQKDRLSKMGIFLCHVTRFAQV